MPESERTETLTRRGSERDERGERARERELGVETRGGEHGFQNKTLGTHTHTHTHGRCEEKEDRK